MSREALHALLRDLPPELQRAVQVETRGDHFSRSRYMIIETRKGSVVGGCDEESVELLREEGR